MLCCTCVVLCCTRVVLCCTRVVSCCVVLYSCCVVLYLCCLLLFRVVLCCTRVVSCCVVLLLVWFSRLDHLAWKYNRKFVGITEMPPSKILQGRYVEPGCRCFFSRQKQVFLVGFSLTFPRFPRKSDYKVVYTKWKIFNDSFENTPAAYYSW